MEWLVWIHSPFLKTFWPLSIVAGERLNNRCNHVNKATKTKATNLILAPVWSMMDLWTVLVCVLWFYSLCASATKGKFGFINAVHVKHLWGFTRWINNIRKKYYVQLKITVTRLSAQAQLFDVIMTIQIQWGYSPRWPRPPRPAPAPSWPPCWTPATWSGSSRWRGAWWRPGPSASSPGSVASLCCRPATTTSPSSKQT